MSDCKQDSEDAKIVQRARSSDHNIQILECRECGRRWSE